MTDVEKAAFLGARPSGAFKAFEPSPITFISKRKDSVANSLLSIMPASALLALVRKRTTQPCVFHQGALQTKSN